jgi:hypothetical protein
VLAVFLAASGGGFEVARIVDRVEDAEHVDAVLSGGFHELGDHIVGVVR